MSKYDDDDYESDDAITSESKQHDVKKRNELEPLELLNRSITLIYVNYIITISS